MHYRLTFSSALGSKELTSLLHEMLRHGPFAESNPEPTGPNAWFVILAPRRADMHVGFASVAELQLRLCRYVEIDEVSRINSELFAVAS